jgi:hypothetical protein
VTSLRLGARIGVTIAALILVFAAYEAWVPVDITGYRGIQFNCGSVIRPPSGLFQVNTCGAVVDRQRTKMIFSIIAAVVLAAGSIYAFGFNRRHEQIVVDSDDLGEESEVHG